MRSEKGCAQKRGLFEHKFRIVRIGRFWRFQRDWMRKICGISWACKKTICNGISGPQLTSNTNSVENFYSKFTKVFPEAVHGYFCWKLVYFGSGTKKNVPSLSYEVRPLAPPTTKYHGIYTILWKCMTRFPILHILANVLRPFAFQFALESPKLPKSPNSNLRAKSPRFSTHPFRPYKKQKLRADV